MIINHIVTSSLVIMFVWLMGNILETKISACFKYALWLLVVVKLLMPFQGFETKFHVLNYVGNFKEIEKESVEVDTEDRSDLLVEDDVWEENIIRNKKHQTTAEGFVTDVFDIQEETESIITGKIEEKNNRTITGLVVIKSVYLTGTVVCLGIFLMGNIRFYKKFKAKRKYIKVYKKKLPVYKIENYYGACLYGGFRPNIIIGNNEELTIEQQHMILLHEYVHYIHGDHIWSMVRCLCVALYWYNPLVWIAASVSRKDGELACDEGTIKRIGKEQRVTYGQTILEIAAKFAQNKNSMTAMVFTSTTVARGKAEMKKRIVRITKENKKSKMALALTVVLSFICMGCTLGNPMTETSVQESSVNNVVFENEVEDEENKYVAEYETIEPDEHGYRWLSEDTYIYELEDLDQNGVEEYVKVWHAEKETEYFCRFTFYWNGEEIYEYDDPCKIFPGDAKYLDLDQDGEKEIFFPFYPAANSMPLMEYIVLKQKEDMLWEPLEMIHGEEMWQNGFPIFITKGKNEWEAVISCGELGKTLTFDLKFYYTKLKEQWETNELEEKEYWNSLILDYEKGFPKESQWYTFGSVCAWGIWNIQAGEYQGQPCLIATHGIQGYDKFDFWGELDVYFDYDTQGKTNFLDMKFRNSESWAGEQEKIKERVAWNEEILNTVGEKSDEKIVKTDNGRFIWPTVSTTISSNYGERVHPITGEKKKIYYMGIAGNEGDSVYAVFDGVISDTGFDDTLGNYIVLNTESGEVVTYGHLSGSKVPTGAQVKTGEIIGLMGKTGNATGTFLSISVMLNGETIDPMLYF